MMEFLQSNMTAFVATGTLISNVLFVLFIVSLTNKIWRNKVYSFIDEYILQTVLVFSLMAVLGSLAYSNIMGFPPCELCWIQRIFMFPIPVIALVAILRKDKNAVWYMTPLIVLGFIVSLYHALSNLGFGAGALPCTAVGGECSKLYVLEYGYITIPFMSFTIFAYLLTIMLIHYKSQNVRG